MSLLERFNPKPKASEPLETYSVQIDVDGQAPPAESDDLAEIEQLPPFEKVLTLPNEDMALGEGQRVLLAALKINKSTVLVLVTRKANNSNEHRSLVQRAKRTYTNVSSQVVRGSLLIALYDQEMKGVKHKTIRVEGEEAQALNVFLDMAERAVREKASDLHVEISEETGRAELRYRIDGELLTLDGIPATHALDAVGHGYTKRAEKSSRNDGTFNKRRMQSCNIPLTVDGEEYTLRWQSAADVGGMDVVLRVLETRANGNVQSAEELGFEPGQRRLLELMVRSKGAIVITGETGSGKSTSMRTLQSMYPNREHRKIISIEDPVEYRKSGVTEISIQRTDDDEGDPFVAAMRASLRMDPDLLMPGEIRDRETGSLFKTMVQSGHKVITTLHAGSAIETIDRLASDEIGLPRSVLGNRNFLAGILYQDLVAKLCPECHLPAQGNLDKQIAEIIEQKFRLSISTMFVTRPEGCPHCRGRGTKGRIVVAEILPMNRDLMRLIREGKDAEAEELWRAQRITGFNNPDMTGKTIFEHGLYKMHRGLIDPMTLTEELSETFELYEVFGEVHASPTLPSRII